MKSPVIPAAACITLAWLALAGCGKQSASVPAPPPPSDPWLANLETMQKEYESNEAKLLADWPAVLKQAKAGTLPDANKLSQDIDGFDRELNAQREKLEEYNRQLSNELMRRGLVPKGKPGVL